MKKTIVIIAAILPTIAPAGTYEYEANKREMCEKIGGYAELTLREAQQGRKTNMSQRDVGHLKPIFAYIETEIGGHVSQYDAKNAYMKGWAHCMDNIERLDMEYKAKQ